MGGRFGPDYPAGLKRNLQKYQLPNKLNNFQLKMYVHLINWKWTYLTRESGYDGNIVYDAILPDKFKNQNDPLYTPIKEIFLDHQKKFSFKSHKFIGHMASSQAACANLFLPILKDPNVAAMILSKVKIDLKRIANEFLDNGFRIEFWDEPDNMLNDHNKATGTDSDIAIAYYDHQDNLNLWLIEHKLTEVEFTFCGGFKSKGRTPLHVCQPTSEVIENPDKCYYQSSNKYNYWNITLGNNSPFNISSIKEYDICPFRRGLNQLWRNQLLAACIESSTSSRWPYKKVYFSVVYHPKNNFLKSSISEFQKLIDYNDRFFTFTSDELVNRAKEIKDTELSEWLNWYQELYLYNEN